MGERWWGGLGGGGGDGGSGRGRCAGWGGEYVEVGGVGGCVCVERRDRMVLIFLEYQFLNICRHVTVSLWHKRVASSVFVELHTVAIALDGSCRGGFSHRHHFCL